MKIIIFILTLFLVQVGYSQDFDLTRKAESKGYLMAYIEYKDSMNFQNNTIAYYFIEDEGFNNNYLSGLQSSYQAAYGNTCDSLLPLDKIHESFMNKRVAVYRDYAAPYATILKEPGKFNNVKFIADIHDAADSIKNNASSGLKNLFITPGLKSNKKYGVFYSIVKVEVTYYTANYKKYEDFEKSFMSTTSDLKTTQMVGIQGNKVGAKLKRISGMENKYPVLLPVSIARL